MKNLSISQFKYALVLAFMQLFSVTTIGQNNVAMTIANQTMTANEIQFDILITNDGPGDMSLWGAAFGVQFNTAILNNGTPGLSSFNYITNTANPASIISQLDYHLQYSNHQLRFTSCAISGAIPFSTGQVYKLGRFTFTNTVNWAVGFAPELSLTNIAQLGKTKCEVAIVPNGSSMIVLLPGASGTLTCSNNCATENSTSVTDCDSYTWLTNNQTYTASGNYFTTSINAWGCVHTETLELTINNSTSNSSTATACDSYIWLANAQTYTASGTYTVTSLNAAGCVHTEILNLTIDNSTSNSSSATACDSYIWLANALTYIVSGTYTLTSLNAAGCVHIETLNLTVNYSTSNSTSVTALDSYFWSANGQTYIASGTYTVTSLNAADCVHTETLNLIINSSPPPQITLNLKFYMFADPCNIYPFNGAMFPVLYNQGVSTIMTDVDDVTITLRDATPAHNIVDSYTGILQTNGELQCTFNNTAAFNQNLYIVINHRNSFETWSASPILTPLSGGSYAYNFSDAASKAFNNNQFQIQSTPALFAIYGSDINQNSHLDLADYIQLLEAVRDFLFGFEVTDLNGDGNVDLLDQCFLESTPPFTEKEIPN